MSWSVNPRTGWPERWATRLRMDVAGFEQRLGEIWNPGSVGGSTLEQVERETAAAFNLDDSALTELMDDAWTEYVGTLNDELVVCIANKWGLWYGGGSAHLPLRLRSVTSSDRCSRS